MVMVVLEALELALLAMAGWDNEGSDARKVSSYSVQTGGIVVTYICTVLASLGADLPFTLGVALGTLGRCAALDCASMLM